MKTVRWTVFTGEPSPGVPPTKKPATKSPEAERSEARKAPSPFRERGLGERVSTERGLGKTRHGLSPHVIRKVKNNRRNSPPTLGVRV